MKCLDTANGDSTQCQGFWEALKVGYPASVSFLNQVSFRIVNGIKVQVRFRIPFRVSFKSHLLVF